MEVSVIIPAYNEELRLPLTLQRYGRALADRFHNDFEIVVVANGCTDRTVDVARAASAGASYIRVVEVAAPIGKGGAVLEGFQRASGRIIAFVDADCATTPRSLLALIDLIEQHDIVIGSRRLPRSTISQPQPPLRRLFGYTFALSTRLLFSLPYRDTQCGAKVFRQEVATRLAPLVTERRWTFDLDLLLWARALGYQVAEHPVSWANHPGSQLRLTRTTPDVVRSLWRMHHQHMHRSSQVRAAQLQEVKS